ncbi:Mo-co oxidoreductase dimerisation domain-containing protein [Marinococcus luteus]|uniref:Mo-co oxidoreductase dimerisation domain-containing protein n=1 Tax=Marinococcus luteus TaxID=1122204 RepID=A0A1H2T4V6_9BACI|nr:sulfite oxidase [Marinococcus luteus]SDW38892.1 Mo-co oxidoreductase dimerisation domain-containing protein [Marinococcus luteus]
MCSKKVPEELYLKTLSLEPENQETPIPFVGNEHVHSSLFYRRNHFPYPQSPAAGVTIDGLVDSPGFISLEDIQALPSRTVETVLECAGNKRSLFEPKAFGEPWGKGAISQGKWKGVPLKALLGKAGWDKETAVEVITAAGDAGERPDKKDVYAYTRSLPVEKAMDPDTIIAYEYNGQPLSFKHGAPLRLIVPGWYAMASMKWIERLTVSKEAFEGPFQAIDYVYYPHKNSRKDAFPVTTMNVNSIIQSPADMEITKEGTQVIEGIAWSGEAVIELVEVSTDGGQTWAEAQLEPRSDTPYTWTKWFYEWPEAAAGEYTLMARARDAGGRQQPMQAFWNQKGYGYNAVETIQVKLK